MSAGPDRYVVDAVIDQHVIDADEARAIWQSWEPALRTGSLEDGFAVYARGEAGHRIAAVTYTPLPGVE
jgi:hypothetical protein